MSPWPWLSVEAKLKQPFSRRDLSLALSLFEVGQLGLADFLETVMLVVEGG
jgi:hypothetical protein